MALYNTVFMVFDVGGTMAFAISGALVGIRNRLDISAICVLAFITCTGGGTMRDLIIGAPVFWTQNLWFILMSIGPAILVFLFYCFASSLISSKPFANLREFFDALGLVAFTVGGVSKALVYHEPAVVAVMMGVLTAVGGGMLRDVFARETPMVFKSQLYATPCLLGGVVYVIWAPHSVVWALCFSTIAILFLRMMGIYRNWHLPFPKIVRR